MDPDGTATTTTTTTTHLCSAAAAECFAIAIPVAHGPRGRAPAPLFLYCNRHAQWPFTKPHLSPQRQTSSHRVFYIPHSPLLTQDWLYVHFYVINIVAYAAASGACIHGLTNARATSRRRILAGIFRFLFVTSDFWRLWHGNDVPRAGMGCG